MKLCRSQKSRSGSIKYIISGEHANQKEIEEFCICTAFKFSTVFDISVFCLCFFFQELWVVCQVWLEFFTFLRVFTRLHPSTLLELILTSVLVTMATTYTSNHILLAWTLLWFIKKIYFYSKKMNSIKKSISIKKKGFAGFFDFSTIDIHRK